MSLYKSLAVLGKSRSKIIGLKLKTKSTTDNRNLRIRGEELKHSEYVNIT